MTNVTTSESRASIEQTLDFLRIAKKTGDGERERVFTIHIVRYLEALKRAHSASDVRLAARIERFVVERDYEAAIQVWEGRR